MNRKLILPGNFSRRPIPRKDGTETKVNHLGVLKGVLAKLFKGANGKEVVDLLEDEEATTESVTAAILEADKTRVSELNKGKSFQDGYAKAKKEERAAFEAEIKEKHGIEEGADGYELTGQDLIDHIVQAKTGEAAAKGAGKDASKLTADEIKALPGYHEIEKNFKKQLKDTTTEWEKKVKSLESGQEKEKAFSSFESDVLKMLDELNPVLPKDPKVANTWKKNFVDSFKKDYDEISKNDDGSYTFLKNEKVVDDGHGNSADWKDIAKSTAGNYFEFQENNGGSNAGNSNEGKDKAKTGTETKKGYPDGYIRPKNTEEFAKVVNDKTIAIEIRKQYSEAYNSENSATGS